MLTPLGAGLIVGGLYWLLLTVARRVESEGDVRASEQREKEVKERHPLTAGAHARGEWASRTAYRHPVLVRRPAQLCVVAGVILILIDTFR